MHQIGPCPILRVEFNYRAQMDEATSSLFSSLLHPYWRESEAQLTEKQAVLLMHNTLPQGTKSVHSLLKKRNKVQQLAHRD